MRLLPRYHRTVKFAVLALAALHAAVFGFYTCLQHERFRTFAYDLGTFDQGIWLAGQGGDLFVTVRGLHLLGDHVRLFSFVLAPLYWAWDDVRALLVLQSVVIAAGAFFLARLASRELPGRPWLVLALVAGYLLHPAVQNLNLDHAHPDAFATTLLLACLDFLRAGRLLPFSIAAALAMSCKEDVPLVFVALGFALMLDPRQRRVGAVLAAVAGTYFAMCIGVILPAFNGVGFFRTGSRGFFAGLGSHAMDPSWLLARLFRPESADYLFSLGAPNLFLFLLSPLSAVPALPALAANLLSDASYPRDLHYHYQTSILPFLYLATIDTLARFQRARDDEKPQASDGRGSRWSSALLFALPALLFAAALAANARWSRLPLPEVPAKIREAAASLKSDQRIARLHRLVDGIPADAVVSAHYTLVPHLSHRRGIYLFPNPFEVSEWGIAGEHPHDPESVDYIFVQDALGHERATPMAATIAERYGLEPIERDNWVALYARPLPAADATCGDWDGDGSIDAEDQRRIGAAVLRSRGCPLHVCDADGDGAVRAADVMRIGKRVGDPAAMLRCPPRRPGPERPAAMR
ncbi:MAG: DUF2079 domain-containing protein [Candidatus Binatia bacterium]